MIKKTSSVITILFFSLFIVTIQQAKAQQQSFDYSKFYTSNPSIENCNEGFLKNDSKLAVLAELNYIRSLHKLPPVTYNYSFDDIVQKAALISAANVELNHNPAPTAACFSPQGKAGCGTSNLSIAFGTTLTRTDEENIISWLIEGNSPSIGHRRWMLSPFLKYISYGRVDGKSKNPSYNFVSASALKVINTENADIKDLAIEYVAYPFENYPSKIFSKTSFLSFSVVSNKNSIWANSNVDFKGVNIQVKDSLGHQLQVSAISSDNVGFGLPNSLQWKADGLIDNMRYYVTISNVTVAGIRKNYNYSFKLIK